LCLFHGQPERPYDLYTKLSVICEPIFIAMSKLINFKLVLPDEVDGTNQTPFDIQITPDGQLGFLSTGTEADIKRATTQGLYSRLKIFKGEYFLNLEEGIPYFDSILVKNPSLTYIRSVFLSVLQSHPWVVQVDTLKLNFNKSSRTLNVEFNVIVDGGIQVTSADFGPLLLEAFNRQSIQNG
jgi:hypothetical protein